MTTREMRSQITNRSEVKLLQSRIAFSASRDAPDKVGISIVIPAYNEEGGLGQVLTDLSVYLGSLTVPSEIIVVDDGSQDRTGQIAHQHPGITLLRHGGNRGYGASLKTGIRHANYEVVAIADADGTYPIDSLPELIKSLMNDGYDMVIGSRNGKSVAIPTVRKPAKWIIGKLANMVAGEYIPDVNSGLRVFRRSVALRFFRILPDGFSFTTTITLGMLTNGYLVHFTPIDYRRRIGKSKIRPINSTLSFFQLILRISLYFAPLKVFLPISGLFLLLAIFWGLASLLIAGELADVSTLIITLTAVQVAMVGMLAELINQRLPNSHRSSED